MKTITVILLMLTSLIGRGQNGGQHFENNVIRINYLGYSDGRHLFNVCNKQDCQATIRTKADQDPAIDVLVAPLSCETISVARPTNIEIRFRAKAETACISRPDMGWLEINTALLVLPLKEETDVVREEKASMSVRLTNNILRVTTGNYKQYDQTTEVYSVLGVRKYYSKFKMSKSSIVDLNNHLHLGMNYIKVTLESGVLHQFVIRNILSN